MFFLYNTKIQTDLNDFLIRFEPVEVSSSWHIYAYCLSYRTQRWTVLSRLQPTANFKISLSLVYNQIRVPSDLSIRSCVAKTIEPCFISQEEEEDEEGQEENRLEGLEEDQDWDWEDEEEEEEPESKKQKNNCE